MIPINLWTILGAAAIALALFGTGVGTGAVLSTGTATKSALSAQQDQFDRDRKADQDNFNKIHEADLAALQADHRADDALAALARTSGAILKGVNNVPRQTVCIDSPAMRAYFDGLRAKNAGTDARTIPNAPPH